MRHAHRLTHASTDPRDVFYEFGRWRWLVVPASAALFALFVWVVGLFAGAAS